MAPACQHCGCAGAHPAHALLAMLAIDDLDAAMEHGLLDALPCPGCDAACNVRLIEARDARHSALAARERHRARAAADVLARALAKAARRGPR